jgi:hypothetical protein
MGIHRGISGGRHCWVGGGPGMLPFFSQGGCLCGAVAVEGSISCICMPSGGTVGALMLGMSAGVATTYGALFAAMLVSGVPACT